MLIAAKTPIALRTRADRWPADVATSLDHRLLDVWLPAWRLDLLGIYSPVYDTEDQAKIHFWNYLHRRVRRRRPWSRLIIAGDVNGCPPAEAESGRGYSTHLLEPVTARMADAWALRNPAPADARDRYTWYSQRKGIRLDYVLVSPNLRPTVRAATHIHSVREQGVSDHSAVAVDLALLLSDN